MEYRSNGVMEWWSGGRRGNTQIRHYDELAKSPPTRHPGEPGVHNYWSLLDSGFRRNDGKEHFSTFCETIIIVFPKFLIIGAS